MIRLGTSGFSYDDWVGHFYPEGIQKSDMLRYYAEHFDTVEVNYTYYRLPNARTLSQMAAKTGEGFEFVIKANREMTHERAEDPEVFRQFAEALTPLREQQKFGCILAQFPYSFKPTREGARYLRWFREQVPSELPTVVEFRNSQWVHEKAFELLEELSFGFCCVDEPDLRGLMPGVAVATSPEVGYVRFHGRNAEKWFEHEEAWERYDYLYTEDELAEWVDKVKDLAEKTERTYLFFNNHYQSKAVVNANMFQQLLGMEV
ncbi:MAG: DUF72 domain-containing protein [Armatimonadota bacterium]